MITFLKELFDQKVIFSDLIHSAFSKVAENRADDLKIHFVYAGSHYGMSGINDIESFILKGMKIHKIESVILTMVDIRRKELITKEKMETYCTGKESVNGSEDSVNDNLESFFQDIRDGKQLDTGGYGVWSYFLPKLTKEELKLVEKRDQNFLETFSVTLVGGTYDAADVDEAEMKFSESKSKFVYGLCWRATLTVKNPSIQ